MRGGARAVDRFEGLPELAGDGISGGDGVRPGLDLDGAVAVGGLVLASE